MIAPEIDPATFHADVQYIESLWQPVTVGDVDLPLIDTGKPEADPLVFVPILEHLEFVYARQIRAFSRTRRVIMYRRQEARTRPVGLAERAEELRRLLDALELERVDLVGHGDAAMVLFEFAERWPQRCRRLIIVAQGADYRIAPHPFIWLLHELFLRVPVEYVLPAWLLRRIVIRYIVARKQGRAATAPATDVVDDSVPAGASTNLNSTQDSGLRTQNSTQPPVCRLPRALIEEQFRKIGRWPFVYKFSVLPIIHYFDMRQRLGSLTMPILLINRTDDVLSPEHKTRRLAGLLPNCIGYHVIPGGERFFMYTQAETVNAVIEQALTMAQEC